MNPFLKHFSKKAVALVLALAVVLCAVTASLSVFADDTNDAGSSLTDAYLIKDSAPVIPMDFLTTADMSQTFIEIDGSYYPGSQIVFTSTSEALIIDNDKDTITARGIGVFPVTATCGEVSRTVYVAVKEMSETEWVLYSKTFTEGELPSDWSAQYWNTTKDGKTWIDITAAPTTLPKNSNPGLIPFNYTTPGVNVWQTHGMFTLNNDIVADFADYTIDLQAVFYGHLDSAGSFVYGRASTTNGKLTTDSNMYGFTVDTRNKADAPYSKVKYTTYTGNAFANTNILGDVTDWTSGLVGANKESQAPMRNWIVKFEGSKGTVYDAEDTAENHIFTYEGIPVNKGTVGVGTFTIYSGGLSGWTKINTIKIKLNEGTKPVPTSAVANDTETVKSDNPVLNVKPDTEKALDNLFVEIGGSFYAAKELAWQAASDSVSWTDALTISSTAIKGTKDGLYKAVVTADGGKQANVYIYVKDISNVPEDEYIDNGNYKFTLGENGNIKSYAKIYEELPFSEKIIIPAKVDGVNATAVGTNLFKKNETIFSVYFEDGITSIGNAAFSDAKRLKYVYFPNTLEKLEEWSFNATAIKKLVLPNSLINWSQNTFTWMSTIEEISIGKGVKTLPAAFTDIPNAKELKLPYTITKVDTGALKAFSGIQKLYIYNRDAVLDGTKLKAGDTVTIYGATYASDGVSPSTAKALAEANGNNFVAIDDEIKAIEDELKAEIEAENAKIEEIAKTEDTAADYALLYDVADKSATRFFLNSINPSNATVGVAGKYTLPSTGLAYAISYSSTPAYLTGEKVYDAKITTVGANAMKSNAEKDRIYNLVISEGYMSIGDSAFYSLPNLRYLTLPSTLTKIENYAFGDAVNLKSLEIPNNLITIGNSAFSNTSSLTEIKLDEINSSLVSIGEAAFTNAQFTLIKLPATTRTIGKRAFAGSALKEVYIYNAKAEIGTNAFPTGCKIYGVTGSTAEEYAKTNGNTFVAVEPLPVITIDSFEDNGNYTFGVDGSKISSYKRKDETKAYSQKVTFPATVNGTTVKYIADNLFKGKNYTTTIGVAIFSEGIEVIGDSAFAEARRLKFVSFPKSLVEIKNYAFLNCGITGDIVLGEKVKSIGINAFVGNSNLTSVTISNPKAVIAENAFAGFGEGFKLRGLDGSTAYEYYQKNKKDGIGWESIGVYESDSDDDNSGDGNNGGNTNDDTNNNSDNNTNDTNNNNTNNNNDTNNSGNTNEGNNNDGNTNDGNTDGNTNDNSQLQQNAGDGFFGSLEVLLGVPSDLTLLLIIIVAGAVLLLIIIAIIIIVLVAKSNDDDDDDGLNEGQPEENIDGDDESNEE